MIGCVALKRIRKTINKNVRQQAIDVLRDQRLVVLDTERYDAFVHALDNSPAPGPKLKSLVRRKLAWQK